MMEYDKANVKRWKEEIDTLLVFAGLFSAVVTAFLVESCKSLHPEPAERIIALLEVIAAERRNSTIESGPEVDTRFVPADKAPLVNALWFTSLIFSLAVAFVGLLVKQWFGEYTAGLMTVSRSRVSKKHARARQYRHDAMRKWHLRTIMIYLPVILQLALIFFLVGLCELLWSFNLQVAKVAVSFVVAIGAFSIFTSVLATICDDCSYRSPHAFVLYFIWKLLVSLTRATLLAVYGVLSCVVPTPPPVRFGDTKEPHTPSPVPKKTPSLCLPTTPMVLSWLKSAGEKRTHWSWKEREEFALSMSCQDSYDASMLDELDRVKMDLVVLRDVVQPCLQTLPLEGAFACVRNILTRRADAHAGDLPEWNHAVLDSETLLVLVNIVLDLLGRKELIEPVRFKHSMKPDKLGRTLGQRRQAALEMQTKTLGMLEKLGMIEGHFFLPDETRSSAVSILMAHRRHLMPDGGSSSSRQLVYVMLSQLCAEIAPEAVETKDVNDVISYGETAVKQDFPAEDRAPLCVATLAVTIMGAVIARTPPFPDALTPLDITSFLNRATKVSHEKLSHVVAGFYVSPLSIEALAELRAATIEFLTAVESVLPSDGSVCLQEPVWTELKQNVAVIFSRFPAQNASYAEGESEIFESIDKILQGKATAPSRVRRPPVTRTTADSLPKTLLRSADSMHHPSPPPSPTDTIACHGRFVFPFFHRKGTKDVSDLCAV